MSQTVMDRPGTMTGTGPIQVSYTRQESYSRLYAVPILGIVIRAVLLIPHLIALYVLGAILGLVHLVAWIPVLFSGTYPQWAYSVTTGVLRWGVRVGGYYFGLTDKYPPFSMSGDDDYPIQVSFQYPSNPGKMYAIPLIGYVIRVVLLVPHLIALYVLGAVVGIMQLFLWIPVISSGQYPEMGWSVVGGYLRWSARVYGYLYGLTDEYPPFQLAA